MTRGRGRDEDVVELGVEEVWWPRFYSMVSRSEPEGWGSVTDFCLDPPTVDKQTLYRARKKGHTSRRTFETLVKKLQFSSAEALLKELGCPEQNPGQESQDTGKHGGIPMPPAPPPWTSIARTISEPAAIRAASARIISSGEVILSTQPTMPQAAHHNELDLGEGQLESVACRIETESPYFRFGFKMLCEGGPIFPIPSLDANLVVHIGRNNWDRTNPAITARDIFLAWYQNGIKRGDPFPLNRNEGEGRKDKKLFEPEPRARVSIKLAIDRGHVAQFFVNDECCLRVVVPPAIRRRLVMLAWGDSDDYVVQVSELQVQILPPI